MIIILRQETSSENVKMLRGMGEIREMIKVSFQGDENVLKIILNFANIQKQSIILLKG